MKILIVDDEPSIVAGLSAMLELHDFATEGAHDCDSAEERLTAEFFPVILADVRMRSEEDGLRLLDSIRRLSPRSRVASMTGYADAAAERRLRDRGAHTVLHKPLLDEDVIGVLREMLALVDATEAACTTDDELYTSTVGTLHTISRRRYGLDREDAEDLVQEAWLLLLEKRAAVRAPRAWLSGAMTNLCRQRIERRARERERAGELTDDRGVASADESMLVVHQALDRVDGRTRALCTMIGLEQRSYDEVSRALRIPLGSVGPSYLRAKARMREALSN